MKLNFIPIKTRVVHTPKDEIWDIIDSLEVQEGDIIFITSKILSIHQGRTMKIGEIPKEELIRREAERYLAYKNPDGNYHVNLTVNQNVLIPAAGIDESNADGYYIMWPRGVDNLCQEIRKRLMQKFNIKKLGVIATDSHTTPLRWGVTGITIGLAGVNPLRDIRGVEDLFGRPMHVTQVNLIDPLTSMAVLIMGEASEATPIVILRGYQNITFDNNVSMENFKIEPEIDIYSPLIQVLPKTKE